jgi:hypothetical protein
MKNYKMFGIWICGFTIIPCYYDFVRYSKKIRIFAKYKFNIFQFTNMWYEWRKLFDSNLDENYLK